jgi:hypothetical protein
MTDGLTDTQRAFLSSRALAADFEDMSAQDINRMSFDEWAARTGRATVSEIAAQAHAYAPPSAQRAPAPAQAAPDAPQQPDVAAMSWQEYAAYRESSGLAQRSSEGMSRAALSMSDRRVRNDVPANGRRSFYSGQ